MWSFSGGSPPSTASLEATSPGSMKQTIAAVVTGAWSPLGVSGAGGVGGAGSTAGGASAAVSARGRVFGFMGSFLLCSGISADLKGPLRDGVALLLGQRVKRETSRVGAGHRVGDAPDPADDRACLVHGAAARTRKGRAPIDVRVPQLVDVRAVAARCAGAGAPLHRAADPA